MASVAAWLLIPSAHAAGTYIGASGYQSPQRTYQGGQAGGGYYQPRNVGTSGYSNGNYYQQRTQGGYQQNGYGYGQPQQQPYARQNQGQNRAAARPNSDGFYMSAGVSRQYAQWNFDMAEAKSILDYGDIAWNVLDVRGGYKFGDFVIDGGVQYGMQAGKSSMTDDDISAGGMEMKFYGNIANTTTGIKPDGCKDLGNGDFECSTYMKVLSIGESSGGSMLGLNLGLGMDNKFVFGKTRIIPSIGYRMFQHKLSTKDSHGTSISHNWCKKEVDGNVICPGFMWTNNGEMTWGEPDVDDGYFWWNVSPGTSQISNGDTYAFSAPGVSHAYDTSWNGPYVAMDLVSELNENNRVDARLELGMPGYYSKGDQPYRADWEHPVSVEDKKDMFGAMHIGVLANWTTMINNNWGLTFGLTFDYYTVSGASASTHMSKKYYEGIWQAIFDNGVNNSVWTNDQAGWDQMLANDATAASIKSMYDGCGGSWTCVYDNEVNSFYRSIGVRVGLAGKF